MSHNTILVNGREQLAAKQAATVRNAEDRRAARTAEPCLCTTEGAAELLRQTKDLLHESQKQTVDALSTATKAKAAFKMTLDSWLGGSDGCASQYGRS